MKHPGMWLILIIVGVIVGGVLSLPDRPADSQALLSEPWAGEPPDSPISGFERIALDGTRLAAQTDAGVILYDHVDTDSPKLVARLPYGMMSMSGGLIALQKVSTIDELWSPSSSERNVPSDWPVSLFTLSSTNELSSVGEVVVPSELSLIELAGDYLMTLWFEVEVVESELSVEGEPSARISLFDIADLGNPELVLDGFEIDTVLLDNDVTIAGTFVIVTRIDEAGRSSEVIVIDFSNPTSPGVQTVDVGFETGYIGVLASNRIAVLGTDAFAVVSLVTSGAHSIESTHPLGSSVYDVATFDGGVAYVLEVDSLDSRWSDELVAIDVGAAGGPVELWRDELAIELPHVIWMNAGNELLVVGRQRSFEAFDLSGNEASALASSDTLDSGFEAIVRSGELLFVSDVFRGIRIFEFDVESAPVAVRTTAMPDGVAASTAMTTVSNTLYVISISEHSENELVGIDIGTNLGDVVVSEDLDGMVGEWSRDWSPVLSHYGSLLMIGLNERILVVDASIRDQPSLVDVVSATSDVVDIAAGLDNGNAPVMCYTADYVVYCHEIDGGVGDSIGSAALSLGAQEIEIRNGHVIAAGTKGGLSIASVSVSDGVVEIGSNYPGWYHGTYSLAIDGDLAFVGSTEDVGVQVFDIQDMSDPEFLGYGGWSPSVKNMIAEDGWLFLCSGSALRIVDVTDIVNAHIAFELQGTG